MKNNFSYLGLQVVLIIKSFLHSYTIGKSPVIFLQNPQIEYLFWDASAILWDFF